MKVLLAPLFFHARMCKTCARRFRAENPEAWLGLFEFESMPPLGSFDRERGFVPDYPALLMFDEFVLDGSAYERIKHPGDRTWLREWSELVAALEAEGCLTLADVGVAAKSDSRRRGVLLKRALRRPQDWWQAMAYYNNLTARANQLLGDKPAEAQDYSWEFDPDSQYGVEGSDGEFHDMAVVLSDAENSEVLAHRELFTRARSELASHLREIFACLEACNALDVAPMMWAPYRRYLENQFSTIDGDPLPPSERAGRQFFEIAFPAYAPLAVREFARLRSAKAIGELRSEILRATAEGDALDPQHPQRVLTEALRIEQSVARKRRISGWIATAVGIVPVPGLGLAATAIAAVVDRKLEARERRPWKWFYLVSDGRGGT